MREHGWIEGKHFAVDERWAAGRIDRFPEFAVELVRSGAAAIIAWSTPAVLAAKRATDTIPIVMASSGDAVRAGLVASLSRPGGNVTGVSTLGSEFVSKHTELLRELLPGVSSIGVLFDPTSAADVLALRAVSSSGNSLRIRIESFETRSATEIESVFINLRVKPVGALVVLAGGANWVNRKRIFELAASSRTPAIYSTSEFTRDGGLMSYGVDFLDLTRQATDYVNRILRGASPADLPVEQPTKFQLLINAKTAKALGLTIPQSLLPRADQIIE